MHTERGFAPLVFFVIAIAVIGAGAGGVFMFQKNKASLPEKTGYELPQKTDETVQSPQVPLENITEDSKNSDTLNTVFSREYAEQTPDPEPQTSNLAETLPVYKPVDKQKCTSNKSPLFTHHITDMSAVRYVVSPPTMGAGPSLKTHGYIGTNGANVPLYAPVDMILKDGSHYVGGPYTFSFQASCEVMVRFGHMTNPIDSIKNLLPTNPASDSRTKELSPVSFKAGDLIGYTTGTSLAGNWDFGVYNSSSSNRYESDPDWNGSATYTTAVCPFDYFAPELKAVYVAKFDTKILGGNPPHGESFCK